MDHLCLDCRDYEHLLNESHILLQIPYHENIVRLVGVCPDKKKYALLLEFVDGQDLDELLLSDKDIAWSNRLDVAHQITKGMMHLHSLESPIIHMDLKAKNVLVSEEGQNYHCKVPHLILCLSGQHVAWLLVQIADFGLSKTRAISTQSTVVHDAHWPAGSLGFIAPERYNGAVDASSPDACKVDVYSFAVIMWQLKERELPYHG